MFVCVCVYALWESDKNKAKDFKIFTLQNLLVVRPGTVADTYDYKQRNGNIYKYTEKKTNKQTTTRLTILNCKEK